MWRARTSGRVEIKIASVLDIGTVHRVPTYSTQRMHQHSGSTSAHRMLHLHNLFKLPTYFLVFIIACPLSVHMPAKPSLFLLRGVLVYNRGNRGLSC
ncbi:hypothetical protein L211DRAFT_716811 [Terfezia boudieri ATCC MYA-4762]|uniref:Uncharacterized protein n=1 Tax=Terfezia boudieri ATCC MYA-4762 TaxID=1051890 RepID=A0A3N4LXS6_9PEZI|nr:hypothetical protein L211DRAFT_716811 [Terfezia boudieri ATCC MYA-4762]